MTEATKDRVSGTSTPSNGLKSPKMEMDIYYYHTSYFTVFMFGKIVMETLKRDKLTFLEVWRRLQTGSKFHLLHILHSPPGFVGRFT